MKPIQTFAFFCFLSTLLPVSALRADPQVPDHAAIRQDVLTVYEAQFSAFQNRARELSDNAQGFCAGTTSMAELKASFHDTWLAWAPLDAYQFGPMETLGAALSVNFFPDKKGFVGRALKQLHALPAEDQANPEKIARFSVAAQGLPALERLIYDTADEAPCPLLSGISHHLSNTATALYSAWFAEQGWADLMRSAGPQNPVYMADEEVTRQAFTALDFSILRMREHRLGRPLGTYTRAFPKRAEAWRSGLTNDVIAAQLAGLGQVLDQGFASALPVELRRETNAIIADLLRLLGKIDRPLKEAVKDPLLRVRIEGLQTKLGALQHHLDTEIGPILSVQVGFSAGDGD